MSFSLVCDLYRSRSFLENSWWHRWFSGSRPLWYCQWDKHCSGRLQIQLCVPVFRFCVSNCYVFFVSVFLPLAGERELFQWQICQLEIVGYTCWDTCLEGQELNIVSKSHQYFKRNISIRKIRYLSQFYALQESPWRGNESLQDCTNTWFAFIICKSTVFQNNQTPAT